MNELTVFDYNQMPIRTIQKDSGLWWVLADVCRVLGLNDAHKVAARLDEDERNLIPVTDTLGRNQNTTVINEPGLYSVILRSDKPEAKAFKRWVTHEVLPAIRKNGNYGTSYDKMEIAKMIVSCKTVGAVKAIMTLFDISPTPTFHVPQNANNSVTAFLQDGYDLTSAPAKEVYETYKSFCKGQKLVPSTRANFSKEIHKQTGLTVFRRRIDGILVGFYTL